MIHADREIDYSYHGLQNTYKHGVTTSLKGFKDANGSALSHETKEKMNRLRRQDVRVKLNESEVRNLNIAMAELDRIASALSLNSMIREEAAQIYRRVLKKDMVRGRSIDNFVAASVYAACRMMNIPRPLKTVVKASKREYNEVSKTYRVLLTELKLRPPIDDPFKYLSGIAYLLDVSREAEVYAVELLKKATIGGGLAGKSPRGVAAAALYVACELLDESLVQKAVASAAGTTEVTLRNRCQDICNALNIG